MQSIINRLETLNILYSDVKYFKLIRNITIGKDIFPQDLLVIVKRMLQNY